MSFGVVGVPNAFKGDREPRLSRQPGYGSKQKLKRTQTWLKQGIKTAK